MKRQQLHWSKEDSDTPSLVKNPRIVLIGNPNSGKSSLFNQLTGLNQKIGNFPGVTVDKKSGFSRISEDLLAEIVDLPGCYSVYPRAYDERVVFDILSNPDSKDYPDLAVVVVDLSNLKRNLLLFTQVKDLDIPVILALNMVDIAEKSGQKIDIETLEKEFNTPVVAINARKGQGIQKLKEAIEKATVRENEPFYDVNPLAPRLIEEIKEKFDLSNSYRAYLIAHLAEYNSYLSKAEKEWVAEAKKRHHFEERKIQAQETISRYQSINLLVNKATKSASSSIKDIISDKLDKALIHKYWGYVIFLGIMFFIFQAIFAWAEAPMNFIDATFSTFGQVVKDILPAGPLSDLITEGVIPGIGGILIFIPQIAILFAFIAILEETGYMSRVAFLMDKIMRKFGLSGKSVVPLVSGVACAIPAIMATRNIESWKDRIITILVTPLMSCSARIPVYTILIALAVPDTLVLGFINLQGVALLAMYLIGFLAAILSSYVLKWFIRPKDRSYFIMELPTYKMPRWKNVGMTIIEKVKTFVFEAGKIIIAISVILWALASYGPSGDMDNADAIVAELTQGQNLTEQEFQQQVETYKLEHSFAGRFGKMIEPVIRPLGYDWKIGIALITSFAAREVFVGTMATIYSIGSDDEGTIKSRMQSEINPETGGPRYTMAVSFSLLIFYAFAMQCMSTLAIVFRETKSWKWPALQLAYLSGLAYVSAFIVYNIFK